MISFEVNQAAGKTISQRQWQQWFTAIAKGLRLKKSYRVSVAVVGSATMKRLNRTYRGKNSVTDVLSFGERDGAMLPDSDKMFLGEIIICYPQAIVQAREVGHALNDELAWLLTHGFLHLLGHDHEKPAEARVMRQLENTILSRT